MGQLGFFNTEKRLAALSAKGDPLEAIDRLVPWESFRADIAAMVLTPDEVKPAGNRWMRSSTDPFLPYLRERLTAFPGLTDVRLWRELREHGYAGGYTAVKRAARDIRPTPIAPFAVRFETAPGEQVQVDLARFEIVFTDEPGAKRIVWLFSMVLGYSRLIWAGFVVHQDMQSVLRCHITALEAIGGAPREILYDRMLRPPIAR